MNTSRNYKLKYTQLLVPLYTVSMIAICRYSITKYQKYEKGKKRLNVSTSLPRIQACSLPHSGCVVRGLKCLNTSLKSSPHSPLGTISYRQDLPPCKWRRRPLALKVFCAIVNIARRFSRRIAGTSSE